MSLPPFDQSNLTKFTKAPDPSWSYRQSVDSTPTGRAWLEGEEQGWKTVNTAEYDPFKLHMLMLSGIVPRPIAFVATVSEDGVDNLAPFSWFNMVMNSPPLVFFSSSTRSGRPKDTIKNVRNGKGFTVNIISESFVENANITSIDSPPDFDEWSISGLTKAPSLLVEAPRVKESMFSMECELFQAIDIAHPSTGECRGTLILAHVKFIHIRNDMLNEWGTIDPTKSKPVAGMGSLTYARVGDVFKIPRPSWAKEEGKVQEALQGRQNIQ